MGNCSDTREGNPEHRLTSPQANYAKDENNKYKQSELFMYNHERYSVQQSKKRAQQLWCSILKHVH